MAAQREPRTVKRAAKPDRDGNDRNVSSERAARRKGEGRRTSPAALKSGGSRKSGGGRTGTGKHASRR